MAQAIRIRAAAHSFEGKLFSLVSCSAVSDEIIEAVCGGDAKKRQLMSRKSSAFTGIIDPAGNVIGKPLIDEEGIVYADIDLNKCVAPKQMHDIIGGYNRFDIFDLKVDRTPRQPADFDNGAAQVVLEEGGE
jgi:aliphatic nitrilase